MAQRRPFIGKARGYRDTLLWLTILSHLRDADEKIALICDDNGFSPNPPKDTDGRREESGRGVRELQGK